MDSWSRTRQLRVILVPDIRWKRVRHLLRYVSILAVIILPAQNRYRDDGMGCSKEPAQKNTVS